MDNVLYHCMAIQGNKIRKSYCLWSIALRYAGFSSLPLNGSVDLDGWHENHGTLTPETCSDHNHGLPDISEVSAATPPGIEEIRRWSIGGGSPFRLSDDVLRPSACFLWPPFIILSERAYCAPLIPLISELTSSQNETPMNAMMNGMICGPHFWTGTVQSASIHHIPF